MELFRKMYYKIAVALVDLKIWTLLRLIHLGALITKKPEHMQAYNALNYKFHRS